MKTCGKCGVAQPLDSFYLSRRGAQGRDSTCIDCRRLSQQAWYVANRTEYIVKQRKWRDANKARVAAQQKAWREATNYVAPYNKTVARAMCVRAAVRRAVKKNARVAWANAQRMQEFYFAADFLGMVTGEWHEVDHIVPLQSNAVCGLHWEGNMEVLTQKGNRSKGNRSWPDMPGKL